MKKTIFLVLLLPIAFFSFKKEKNPEIKFEKAKYVSHIKRSSMPPTNEVVPGNYYEGSEIVRSNNGQYSLVYQGDGNLVLYNSSNKGLWASNTTKPSAGSGSYIAFSEFTGNILIVTATNAIYIDYGTTFSRQKCHFVLQDDGNFVVYNSVYSAKGSYSTSTNGGKKSSHFGQFEINY